jgi:cold shock CspA family protein
VVLRSGRANRGGGFISVGQASPHVFFHFTRVVSPSFDELQEGDQVASDLEVADVKDRSDCGVNVPKIP